MSFIKSFGSSSKGNSILVGDVLFDAGIQPRKIKPKPKHVFITHRHGDHMKYIDDWQKRGLYTYGTEVKRSAFGKTLNIWDVVELDDGITVEVVPSLHDTENPCNFIYDDGTNRVLYEVDNAARTYDAIGITHYIAECNWDEATVANNGLDDYSIDRLRATHKSLEILLEELEVMDKSRLQEVWLAHMSNDNLNKELAKETVQEIVGVPVYFA